MHGRVDERRVMQRSTCALLGALLLSIFHDGVRWREVIGTVCWDKRRVQCTRAHSLQRIVLPVFHISEEAVGIRQTEYTLHNELIFVLGDYNEYILLFFVKNYFIILFTVVIDNICSIHY